MYAFTTIAEVPNPAKLTKKEYLARVDKSYSSSSFSVEFVTDFLSRIYDTFESEL